MLGGPNEVAHDPRLFGAEQLYRKREDRRTRKMDIEIRLSAFFSTRFIRVLPVESTKTPPE